MSARIPWKLAVQPGRRARPRLYHESAFPLIAREASLVGRRNKRPADSKEAHWRTRSTLRLLAKRTRQLALEIDQAYGLLTCHPPVETATLHSLPHPELTLRRPLTLKLIPSRRSWDVTLADLPITAQADTKTDATQKFLQAVIRAYETLELDPSSDPDTWYVFQQLVERRPLPSAPPPFRPHPTSAANPPSFPEWAHLNQPSDLKPNLRRAWLDGARSRFRGGSECRYSSPALIKAWRRGYNDLSAYLDSGGCLSCPSCAQILALPLCDAESTPE